jgi:hypothetical protein
MSAPLREPNRSFGSFHRPSSRVVHLAFLTSLLIVLTACAKLRTAHVELLLNDGLTAPGDAWKTETLLFDLALKDVNRQGWHIVIAPISDRSYATSPVFDETLPRADVTSEINPTDIDDFLAPVLSREHEALEAIKVFPQVQGRTEIFAAIKASADRLQLEPDSVDKLMILISTMWEQSGAVNMADAQLRLDERETERILDHLAKAHLQPNLRGVQICVAGLSAGLNDTLRSSQQGHVGAFWQAYFTRAGGTLVSYNVSLDGCKHG